MVDLVTALQNDIVINEEFQAHSPLLSNSTFIVVENVVIKEVCNEFFNAKSSNSDETSIIEENTLVADSNVIGSDTSSSHQDTTEIEKNLRISDSEDESPLKLVPYSDSSDSDCLFEGYPTKSQKRRKRFQVDKENWVSQQNLKLREHGSPYLGQGLKNETARRSILDHFWSLEWGAKKTLIDSVVSFLPINKSRNRKKMDFVPFGIRRKVVNVVRNSFSLKPNGVWASEGADVFKSNNAALQLEMIEYQEDFALRKVYTIVPETLGLHKFWNKYVCDKKHPELKFLATKLCTIFGSTFVEL
ncbi:unnamed protein product [Diabrotica balteata]|uniref:Uncharacterized protein n=1 Tax=Diabrotica balteata TaxID=107213 RepID=A0A9N9T1N4_DIABA|nr:unnamed protein product [Diabrotica balteata]